MESAGGGAAEIVKQLCAAGSRVLVVCGGGNNAGDGYVVARRLLEAGRRVSVVSLVAPERLGGDAEKNYQAHAALSEEPTLCDLGEALPLLQAELAALGTNDVIVDAVFGTGLDRAVEGRFARALTLLNGSPARRIALDVPSGLCADTGNVLGTAVLAQDTVCFAERKLGLCTSTGARHGGRVHVVDIGIPAGLAQDVGFESELVEAVDARSWLVPRSLDVHKRSAGHVLCFAGSPGTSGAALLCAQGALRSGAGLVTLAGFSETRDVLEPRVLEAMTAALDEGQLEASLDALLVRADSVVIGPGFGTGERERRVIRHVALRANNPVVVDADAITCFAQDAAELAQSSASLVLTPHPGELGRLLGCSTAEVEANRFLSATRAAKETGAVVVLKGPYSLVARAGERTWVNDGAAPVLATAGSGDVLAGAVAAFACGLDAKRAAAIAVYLHALSGRLWQRRSGADRGMLAREIADGIPLAIAELANGPGMLPD